MKCPLPDSGATIRGSRLPHATASCLLKSHGQIIFCTNSSLGKQDALACGSVLTADSGATIWQRTFHELNFLVYRPTHITMRGGRHSMLTTDSGATIWQCTSHELNFLVYRHTHPPTLPCMEAGTLPKNPPWTIVTKNEY